MGQQSKFQLISNFSSFGHFRYVKSCTYVAASQILDDETKRFYQQELMLTAKEHVGSYLIIQGKLLYSYMYTYFNLFDSLKKTCHKIINLSFSLIICNPKEGDT